MVADFEDYALESSYTAAQTPQDGHHIRLDMPRSDDLADIVYLANNRSIASMLATMPHPFGLDDAKKLISRAQNIVDNQAYFAIRLISTGRFIGAGGYGPSKDGDAVHLGYWIGEPFWGQGYATEAAQMLTDHAFTHTSLDTLHATCRVNNPASRRVIIKSGYQYRDLSMLRSLGAGGVVSVERFNLDRKTWLALKRWRRA